MKNVATLLMLYARPVLALSQILDQGRLWFSLIVVLGVSFLLRAPDAGPQAPSVLLRFISYERGSVFLELGAIAIVLVPAILLARAAAGFGSFGVLMERDYLALLNCALMSWSAAYLPLAVAGAFLPIVHTIPVYIAANVYSAALTALSVRTVFGTGFAAAAGMTALGWGAALGGGLLLEVVGGMLRFLFSPLLLYFAYLLFGSNVRSLGQGLRSRQHFRRQLEMATNNPRDADAHYQLGLIYKARRQYTEAIARFTQAVAIDPEEADAHLQLGRIAREQNRSEDALRHLQTAVALDDKLAMSEVWRELGAAYFGAARFAEAAAALAKYTDRRTYDPEGLYWYGKTLLKLGRSAEAREMFERAEEAAKKMPSHRRAEVRKWGSLSRSELRDRLNFK